MRRPVWLAAGVAVGVGGTLWAEQRVRRQLRRVSASLTPSRLGSGAVSSAKGAGERVRGALEAGRDEKRRREDELRVDLEAGRPTTAPRPGGPRPRR